MIEEYKDSVVAKEIALVINALSGLSLTSQQWTDILLAVIDKIEVRNER